MYASFLRISRALRPDVFEQPGKTLFQQPARENSLLPDDSIEQSLRGALATKQSHEIEIDSLMLAMTFFAYQSFYIFNITSTGQPGDCCN
jgi:hypothetical protein